MGKKRQTYQAKRRQQRRVAASRTAPQRPSRQQEEFKLYPFSSPFEGQSAEEVILLLQQLGEEAEQQFAEAFQQLQEQLLKVDPCQLLSEFACAYLTTSVGKTPTVSGHAKPLSQHHIELLQALALQHGGDEFAGESQLGLEAATIQHLVEEVGRTSHVRRLKNLSSNLSLQERQRLSTLELMRSQTQIIRNWGYPQQITQIVSDLLIPLDGAIQQRLGVKATDLITMFRELIALIERRLNNHFERLIPMYRASTARAAVEAYQRAFPHLKDTTEGWLQGLADQQRSLQEVRILLLIQSNLQLVGCYTLTLDDFLVAYPGTTERAHLQAAIEQWACSFGDLASSEAEHFLLSNPIWRHPFIRLAAEQYFCPIPNLLLSYCPELMEEVLKSAQPLYRQYEDRRGKFLESEVKRLFVTAFPRAQVYPGSKWVDPSTNILYENDLLVLIDSMLIIVEAKSGKLTDPARRGATDRFQRDVEKLLVEPSQQAKRFAEYLVTHPGIHQFQTEHGQPNTIDTTAVRETIRVNVTLDVFGFLGTRWPDLLAAGVIPSGTEMTPTISLLDLELVFEILEGTCEKLHYLARRAEFEAQATYLGDELDLLAYYLQTGFISKEKASDQAALILGGLSQGLDPYFMQQWTGLPAPKPRRQLTSWWQELLLALEQRRPADWIHIGLTLLDVALEDQNTFEQAFQQRQHPGHARGTNAQEQPVVLWTGPAERRVAIVGTVTTNLEQEPWQEQAQQAAQGAGPEGQVKRIIAIRKEHGHPEASYAFIAALEPNQKKNEA